MRFSIFKLKFGMITEEIVDIEPTEALLKNMGKFPDLAQYVEENNGDVPSCFLEEELYTLDEFRRHIEKTVYERLGFTIKLPSSG